VILTESECVPEALVVVVRVAVKPLPDCTKGATYVSVNTGVTRAGGRGRTTTFAPEVGKSAAMAGTSSARTKVYPLDLRMGTMYFTMSTVLPFAHE
jgi:hypothetical protein